MLRKQIEASNPLMRRESLKSLAFSPPNFGYCTMWREKYASFESDIQFYFAQYLCNRNAVKGNGGV